ncbi:hypothetical protein [Sphingorhabdus sp.]|jgi:hypothetical protein|uniref:hypothetical protein n=1 Tax=Sphingorhabdus sp. TaxID=1902408 RepID=UPI0037C8DFE6
MRSILEGHPPVVAISRSCPVETLRQYNLTQRREDKKKMLARPAILQSYFGRGAPVIGILHPFVILNLFQDNMRLWFVILKQVQDDELYFH